MKNPCIGCEDILTGCCYEHPETHESVPFNFQGEERGACPDLSKILLCDSCDGLEEKEKCLRFQCPRFLDYLHSSDYETEEEERKYFNGD
jgi:hypothetical protein